MKAAGSQPTYLPWMGYFEMIDRSDFFIVADQVQFEKESWQKRNRIKTSSGAIWLSVPVIRERLNTPINRVRINHDRGNPLTTHWKTITMAYRKAPFFERYCSTFKEIYSRKYELLRDLNLDLIRAICGILGIQTEIVVASTLDLQDDDLRKTERIIHTCKRLGVTHLVEGQAGRNFIDLDLFQANNIQIVFQDYRHPVYPQLYGEFIPYLSVIDLIFNVGEESLDTIKQGAETGFPAAESPTDPDLKIRAPGVAAGIDASGEDQALSLLKPDAR